MTLALALRCVEVGSVCVVYCEPCSHYCHSVRVSCVLIMNKGEYYNCHAKPVMNVDDWLLAYYVTEYPTNVHTLHTNNNYWVS